MKILRNVLIAVAAACLHRTTSAYLVTNSPLALGVGSPLCIAVDTASRGIWWWEPSDGGCEHRSTGPGVFPASDPRVTVVPDGDAIAIAFQLPLHATAQQPTFADIRLLMRHDTMSAEQTGARARMVRRTDLEIPGPR